MSVDQIASALWRNRLIFVATFVACLVAVVIVTLSLPKAYRATATLFVGDERTARALEFNPTLGESLTRTYSTLAANPNVANAVLARLPLELSRSELLDRMSFTPVERTQLLQIGAEGGSRAEAKLIANTYATVFVNRVAAQREAGQTQSRVSINEPAALPGNAFKPNPPLYIGLGGLLALFFAFGVTLVRERLDKTMRIPEEEDSVLGHPVLARIPRITGPLGFSSPEIVDAFRLLKTTLDFVDDRVVQALMVTSPGPVEGKTSIATQLAVTDALDGEKVVLIEADLRRPGIAATFASQGVERSETGLTHYLVRSVSEDQIIASHPKYPTLDIIWSGPIPPNPTGLLRSDSFARLIQNLRSRYDRIIVDTPPVSVGADASVTAGQVDATLYVVDARGTSRSRAQSGLNQLKKVRANVLGIVLNNAVMQTPSTYYTAQAAETTSAPRPRRAPAVPQAARSDRPEEGGGPSSKPKAPPPVREQPSRGRDRQPLTRPRSR
jgi:succinoglycan biosynthesis transport protein ExoP